jgi:hypothetical protein
MAILLLKFLQLRSRIGWSLLGRIDLLPLFLFVHRNLWSWLDTRFAGPTDSPAHPQTMFQLA